MLPNKTYNFLFLHHLLTLLPLTELPSAPGILSQSVATPLSFALQNYKEKFKKKIPILFAVIASIKS